MASVAFAVTFAVKSDAVDERKLADKLAVKRPSIRLELFALK